MLFLNINNLKTLANKVRKDGKRLTLVHGVFDLIHVGHVRHLKEASKIGDYLIVSVTTDKYVNKGINRPVYNHLERAILIQSIRYVNAVFINNSPTAELVILETKPNYFVKGIDYSFNNENITSNLQTELQALRQTGGKFLTTHSAKDSTTKIIEKIKS